MAIFWLRTFILSLAGLIGLGALWILYTDLISPQLAYFPADSKEAVVFDAAVAASARAAHIGRIRGDLWAAAAVTEAAPLLFAPASDRPSGASQARMLTVLN